MREKIDKLAERINLLLDLVASHEKMNQALKDENSRLQDEVKRLTREGQLLRTTQIDNSQLVKSRLVGVLDRLEELEEISR